jgi:hypothetical protein
LGVDFLFERFFNEGIIKIKLPKQYNKLNMRLLTLKSASIFLFLPIMVYLTSCGNGGGGGGGGSPASVTSTLSFPLQTGEKASIIRGSSTYYAISGTCGGTASTASSTPVPATFEGVSGISSSSTIILNLTNCTPSYNANTYTDYYDSNYVPLGRVVAGGKYSVYLTPPISPASVKIGDTGSIGTLTIYTDSTKTISDGQAVISYVVEPDTANTAIINMIWKFYNSNGVLTSTEQDRSMIAANGTLTNVSSDIQYANGSTTHLVLTAIPDTTPPTVLSTNPPSNSSAASVATAITATFNKLMDPATINTAEFILMNGTTPVSGTVTYSGSTATFTPAAPLADSTLYTATLATGVKDLAGNAMSSSYSWSFTTTTAAPASQTSGLVVYTVPFNAVSWPTSST